MDINYDLQSNDPIAFGTIYINGIDALINDNSNSTTYNYSKQYTGLE